MKKENVELIANDIMMSVLMLGFVFVTGTLLHFSDKLQKKDREMVDNAIVSLSDSVQGMDATKDEPIEKALARDLLLEFGNDLDGWNASVVYNGKEYTNIKDFE